MISDIDLINSSELEFPIPRGSVTELVNVEKLNEFRRKMKIKEVQLPGVEWSTEYFVKLARYSKKIAIDYLLRNSHSHEKFYLCASYEILREIGFSKNLDEFESDDLAYVLQVLADVTDDLSRINGPVALGEGDIFFNCAFLSEAIMPRLAHEERTKIVLDIIRNGKARSWIMFFVFNLIKSRRVFVLNSDNKRSRLSKEEKALYAEAAKARIREILDDGLELPSKPFYLFELWWDISTESEKADMKKWVARHVKKDINFLRFVGSFYRKQLFMEGIVITDIKWRVLAKKLELFISIDYVKERLESLAENEGDIGEAAREILGRLEYTLNFYEEVKAGLHRPRINRNV